MDIVSRFLARKCEISLEITHCIGILFYANKHDKIKINCVILENISYDINNDEMSMILMVMKIIIIVVMILMIIAIGIVITV